MACGRVVAHPPDSISSWAFKNAERLKQGDEYRNARCGRRGKAEGGQCLPSRVPALAGACRRSPALAGARRRSPALPGARGARGARLLHTSVTRDHVILSQSSAHHWKAHAELSPTDTTVMCICHDLWPCRRVEKSKKQALWRSPRASALAALAGARRRSPAHTGRCALARCTVSSPA